MTATITAGERLASLPRHTDERTRISATPEPQQDSQDQDKVQQALGLYDELLIQARSYVAKSPRQFQSVAHDGCAGLPLHGAEYDLVQELYSRCLPKLGQIEHVEHFMRRSLRNLYRDHVALKRHRDKPLEAIQGRADDSSIELAAIVDEALSELFEQQREAVTLCFIHGYTQEAAAVELGESRKTINRWLASAKEALQVSLADLSELPS